MRKVLTHDLREIFRRCHLRFDLQQRGVRGNIDEQTAYFRWVGKAAEQAIDCASKQERTAVVLQQIQQIPVARQQAALVDVDRMVTRAHAMTSKTAKVTRQRQFSWVDDEVWTPDPKNPHVKPKFPEPTFFTFYAKPDHTEEDRDDRGKIFRIFDGKSGESVRTKDKRQLLFFAFVASKHFAREKAQALARGESYEMPQILMVVGALRSPSEIDPKEVFGYKLERERGSLQLYRQDIANMLEAERLGLFPASIDWDCGRCPFGKTDASGDPATIICDTYRNKVLTQQQGEDADTVA